MKTRITLAICVALFCSVMTVCAAGDSSGVKTGSLVLDSTKLPQMIDVPGGTFRMGTDKLDDNQPWLARCTPSRNVTLSPYRVGETLVTYGLYLDFLKDSGYAPSNFSHPDDGPIENNVKGLDSPVFFVNWYESILFCNWLSLKEGLNPTYEVHGKVNRSNDIRVTVNWNRKANGYRLLTLAEYEFLLRDGGKDASALDALYKWKSRGLKKDGERVGSVLDGSKNSLGVVFLPGMREWTWSQSGKFTGKDLKDPENPDGAIDPRDGRFAPGYIYGSYFYDAPGPAYGYGYYLGIRLVRNGK
jgi:formylglycine-generating enzyme required for sulfatase activity